MPRIRSNSAPAISVPPPVRRRARAAAPTQAAAPAQAAPIQAAAAQAPAAATALPGTPPVPDS